MCRRELCIERPLNSPGCFTTAYWTALQQATPSENWWNFIDRTATTAKPAESDYLAAIFLFFSSLTFLSFPLSRAPKLRSQAKQIKFDWQIADIQPSGHWYLLLSLPPAALNSPKLEFYSCEFDWTNQCPASWPTKVSNRYTIFLTMKYYQTLLMVPSGPIQRCSLRVWCWAKMSRCVCLTLRYKYICLQRRSVTSFRGYLQRTVVLPEEDRFARSE